MIQNVLTHIGGVGAYGIISLCLFFIFFLGMLIWALRLKQPYLDTMRELPLEGDPTSDARSAATSHTENHHE